MMAKKPAIKEYAADMDLTSVGSTDEEIIEAPAAEEIFMSESTKAEMAAGAAHIAKIAAEAE